MITLCADDFGQNADISQGILNLASDCRLSAISCMTQMPAWPLYSKALADIKQNNPHFKTGLHFTLTHLTGQSLAYWMARSVSRYINKKIIYTLINQQCDAFENALGYEPDFIDGHQHVHVFPMIRNVLIQVINQRYAHKRPWIRNLNPLPYQKRTIKHHILAIMSMGFEQLLINNSIPHNIYFGGIYNVGAKTHTTDQFKGLLSYWFTQAEHARMQNAKPFNTLIRPADTFSRNGRASIRDSINYLIMCHPGLLSNDTTDPIAHTRFIEYQVLSSDWFYNSYGHLIAHAISR